MNAVGTIAWCRPSAASRGEVDANDADTVAREDFAAEWAARGGPWRCFCKYVVGAAQT